VIESRSDLEVGVADASLVFLSDHHGYRDLLSLDAPYYWTVCGADGAAFRLLAADAA